MSLLFGTTVHNNVTDKGKNLDGQLIRIGNNLAYLLSGSWIFEF